MYKFWRPIVAIGSVALRRLPFVASKTQPNRELYSRLPVEHCHPSSAAQWPSTADRLYFESEMRMAFMCVQLAASGPASNRSLCMDRAKAIHETLTDWV